MKTEIFVFFDSLVEAKAYRYEYGNGGWIFALDDEPLCILFPPDYYPHKIFYHPLTKGKHGMLYGCQ